MGKLYGFVKLMRPLNCVMMGFAVLVGALLATQLFTASDWLNIAFGFVTGFTLCAAAMAVNDYYDRAIDAINEPSRPIPSGTIKPKEALVFAAVLAALGFVFAFLVSLLCLGVALLSFAVVAVYITVGKRSGLPGNFLVSVCVVIPFIYGGVIPVLVTESRNIILFASMAFLSNTGREITKGIVDVPGDSAQNIKTLAVRYGEKKAAVAASAFYFAAVALSPLPLIYGLVSLWFVPFVLTTDIGLLASAFLLLEDQSRERARKIKNTALVWFVIGLFAYIIGVL